MLPNGQNSASCRTDSHFFFLAGVTRDNMFAERTLVDLSLTFIWLERIITSMPCRPSAWGQYIGILYYNFFDRLNLRYSFKVAFHLHIMTAEICGSWYINDGAYQARHEQGNILQRQFAEHLRLLSRKDSLPVIH